MRIARVGRKSSFTDCITGKGGYILDGNEDRGCKKSQTDRRCPGRRDEQEDLRDGTKGKYGLQVQAQEMQDF